MVIFTVSVSVLFLFFFFFFNDTATTEIYTLSLHDALPIFYEILNERPDAAAERAYAPWLDLAGARSEEHTSELQSQSNLVCRLLLEKKKHKCKTHLSSTIKTSILTPNPNISARHYTTDAAL